MTKRCNSLKEGGKEHSLSHGCARLPLGRMSGKPEGLFLRVWKLRYLSWAEFPFQKSLGGMSAPMMGGFRAGNTLHSDNPLWHSSRPKWPALPISPLSSRELTFPHPVASRDYLMALENLCLRHLLIPLRTFH